MIEVIHYEKANKNKIIGYVDIKIPKFYGMIIRRIAHIQSGDRRWFNLPSFPRDKIGGGQDYFKYWSFELEAHNTQILEALPEKVKEFCERNSIKETEAINFDMPLLDDNELPF